MGDLQFNPMDPEFLENPYPMYHRLRSEAPVYQSPLGFWVLTRYEDVVAALRDPRLTKEPIAAYVAARTGMPQPSMGLSMLDRDPRILPEMGSRVDFLEDTARVAAGAALPPGPPRFRLPAAAVREQAGESVVWLLRDGRLVPRSVQAGPVSAGVREIRGGLAGGERVVVGGVEAPKAGMRVEVKE